ncbi:MAG TPA: superoxide dismutase family protein, partial [Sphingopyxis sp.]|nr:superoxide dismutase family protein [Sphingopyxis sp.]
MILASRHGRTLAAALGAAGALALAGCATMGGKPVQKLPAADASAQLVDARGADRGRADFYKTDSGLRVELVARGFAPGTYGMHLHAVGQCTPPGFTSAGPHWNPTGAQHGRDNPMGAHHGDLPNLVVESGEIGRQCATGAQRDDLRLQPDLDAERGERPPHEVDRLVETRP